MDSALSAAHHARPLLDLVDPAWAADALSDDDLYLPDDGADDAAAAAAAASAAQHAEGGGMNEEEAGPVLTDGQGVTWSLSIPRQAIGANVLGSGGGGGSGTDRNTEAPVLAMAGAGVDGVGGALAGLESADGLRWTDLGLQAYAAHARKQQLPR